MTRFRLVLLFFISFLGLIQAQHLTLKKLGIQTGIDYNKKEYIVFDGYDTFYKKSFQAQSWDTIAYKYNALPINDDFPYNFFHIKGKNYLVSKGCGALHEFRNDSIIRLNPKAYEHKNQFMSIPFSYKDDIYYFGGYGLFTFKNILTKYDYETNAWELVKYSDYSSIPEPRASAIGFLKGDYLYVVSGLTENNETSQTAGSFKKLEDVWRLDLKTKKWILLGKLNNTTELLHDIRGIMYFQTEDNFYYANSRLFAIDFENNTLKYTEPREKYSFSFLETYNTETNEIFYVLGNSDQSNRAYTIITEPIDNFITPLVTTEKLYLDYNWVYYLSGAVLVILVLIILYIKRRKRLLYTANKDKICLKNEGFYYRDRQINNLTSDEEQLLHFFFINIEQALQMNEVVDFFCKNEDKSYNTLTKKKDTVLNGLKQKLAFIVEVEEEDLFLLQKNTEDKRIKEIQLNPQYFTLTKHSQKL